MRTSLRRAWEDSASQPPGKGFWETEGWHCALATLIGGMHFRCEHPSNDVSIKRLVGAVLFEANSEWQLQHRYMGIEAIAELRSPPQTNETLQIRRKAA